MQKEQKRRTNEQDNKNCQVKQDAQDQIIKIIRVIQERIDELYLISTQAEKRIKLFTELSKAFRDERKEISQEIKTAKEQMNLRIKQLESMEEKFQSVLKSIRTCFYVLLALQVTVILALLVVYWIK